MLLILLTGECFANGSVGFGLMLQGNIWTELSTTTNPSSTIDPCALCFCQYSNRWHGVSSHYYLNLEPDFVQLSL